MVKDLLRALTVEGIKTLFVLVLGAIGVSALLVAFGHWFLSNGPILLAGWAMIFLAFVLIANHVHVIQNLQSVINSLAERPTALTTTSWVTDNQWLVDLKDRQLRTPNEFVFVDGIRIGTNLMRDKDRKLSVSIDFFNGSVFGLRIGRKIEGSLRYDTERIMSPKELEVVDVKDRVFLPGVRGGLTIIQSLGMFGSTVASEELESKLSIGNMTVSAEFIDQNGNTVKEFVMPLTAPIKVQ